MAGPVESLVIAAVGGDREALRSLWTDHKRWVAAVLMAYRPSHIDLDDLLQEVAVTLVTKLDTLRDPNRFRPWLRRVAINTAQAAGRPTRATRRTMELDDDTLPAPAHGPSGAGAEARHEVSDVLGRVQRLPETYREPLLLKAVHGMRLRQIADLLDVPETTVETRIARARRMLRGFMSAELESVAPACGGRVEH